MSDSPDMELLAASLRADAADSEALLETLASKLAAALPDLVTVRRRGFRGRGPVSEVTVDLDQTRLKMTADGRRLVPVSSTISGGIVIKNRQIRVDEWIDDLTAGLAAAAERDARTGQALTDLLSE